MNIINSISEAFGRMDTIFSDGILVFWNTPLGIVVTGLLSISSFVIVFRNYRHHDFIDTFYYSSLSIMSLVAFIMGLSDQVPHNFIKVMFTITLIKTVKSAIFDKCDWRN